VTILHIDSSINGENSASREVSASIVKELKGALWGEAVVYRDLASNPLRSRIRRCSTSSSPRTRS
jgi:FMN-dependent NADH-azoreductase